VLVPALCRRNRGGKDPTPVARRVDAIRQAPRLEVRRGGQSKLAFRFGVEFVATGRFGAPVPCIWPLLVWDDWGDRGISIALSNSNLQRSDYPRDAESVGRPKVQSAAETIARINPSVQVDAIGRNADDVRTGNGDRQRFTTLSATDDKLFATRYLVNDVCVLLGKPNCLRFRFFGSRDKPRSVFVMRRNLVYRLPLPQDPHRERCCCREGGVVGVPAWEIVGRYQATMAIKLILSLGGLPIGPAAG